MSCLIKSIVINMQCPGHRYRMLNQSMAGQSAKGIFMNQLGMFTMVYTTSIWFVNVTLG